MEQLHRAVIGAECPCSCRENTTSDPIGGTYKTMMLPSDVPGQEGSKE